MTSHRPSFLRSKGVARAWKIRVALGDQLCYTVLESYSKILVIYGTKKGALSMIPPKLYFCSLLTLSLLTMTAYGANEVSSANSTIDFPHDQAYINTNQPTIIGTLRDDKKNPVANETVQILINGTAIGSATSDFNGIYRFPVNSPLPDGTYSLSIFCVESQAVIESNQFTIDTIAPSVTITYPQNGASINNSSIVFVGTTEADAMVIVFVDGDTFGNICYADDSGNWSIEYDGLANGSHTITAQATDIAGNQGYMSDTTNFSVNF
jgi:hypothetical protein